jgi:hypothetical protein
LEVKVLKSLFFVLLAAGLTLPFCAGSFTFADAARGVEVLQQFLEGGKFNQLSYPDATAPVVSYFVAWWSPGQWLVLYVLQQLGLESVQMQQAVLILLCAGISLFGFYRLFHLMGYTTGVIWWSLLLILCNQAFYWHFFMYYGGELLLLAVFPFYMNFLISGSERKPSIQVFLLVLLCALGLSAKSTFVLFLVAGGIFVLHRTFFRPSKGGKWTSLVVFSFVSFAFVLTYQLFFLSLGSTPSSAVDMEGYQGVPNTWLGDFSFPLGAVTGIFLRISFFFYKASILQGYACWLQVFPMVLFVLLVWTNYRKASAPDRDVLLYFVLPTLLMFVCLFLMNRAVSYEMRHFALLSFLLTPMLVQWGREQLPLVLNKVLLPCLLLLDVSLGVKSFLDFQPGSGIIQGIKVEACDVTLMKAIAKWDQNHKDGLFVIEDYWFPCLAVRRNDKLVLRLKGETAFVISGMELPIPDVLESKTVQKYNGKEVLLVVKSEKSQLFRLFPSHRFTKREQVGAFFLFTGVP